MSAAAANQEPATLDVDEPLAKRFCRLQELYSVLYKACNPLLKGPLITSATPDDENAGSDDDLDP